MANPQATRMTAAEYAEAARRYCESLPPEHFMEASTQSAQRDISVDGFTVYHERHPRYRIFSELLIQYFFRGNLRQVCPDNMLVHGDVPDGERTSWALELEPATIFVTMEYVSPNNKRKDYVDSYRKYERELKVPYYLTVDHESHDLRLHRLDGKRYVLVEPNAGGRLAIPELEVEVGWVGNWVRYWHRGELLPITVELQRLVTSLEEQLEERDKQLKQRDKRIKKQEQQMLAVIQALRPLVEEKARRAGRQDILDQLPATTDATVLTRWLADLDAA